MRLRSFFLFVDVYRLPPDIVLAPCRNIACLPCLLYPAMDRESDAAGNPVKQKGQNLKCGFCPDQKLFAFIEFLDIFYYSFIR